MEIEEIKKKLSTAVYLERESLMQQRVIDDLINKKNSLAKGKVIPKPKYEDYKTKYKNNSSSGGFFSLLIFYILPFFLWLKLGDILFGNAEHAITFEPLVLLFFIYLASFAIRKTITSSKVNSNAQYEYSNELHKYNQLVAEEENRIATERNIAKYYHNEMVHIRGANRTTQDNLKKLYSGDWLYPKYQNLVAEATMLEYLESGRCDSLTGPNGAYNLYENELRLNIIINKLDIIIKNLEQIKNNQFLLYREMTYMNQKLNSISYDIQNGLYQISSDIKANTETLNYNSVAQKYATKEIQKELEYMNNMNYRAGNYDRY